MLQTKVSIFHEVLRVMTKRLIFGLKEECAKAHLVGVSMRVNTGEPTEWTQKSLVAAHPRSEFAPLQGRCKQTKAPLWSEHAAFGDHQRMNMSGEWFHG